MRLFFFCLFNEQCKSSQVISSLSPPLVRTTRTIKIREFFNIPHGCTLFACQHERDNLIGSIFNEKYVVTRMLLKWHIKLLITLLFRIRIILCCMYRAHICKYSYMAVHMCVCFAYKVSCARLSYTQMFSVFGVFRFVDASEHLRNS